MRPTPWGDLEVCDAHVHFFSHAFFTALAGQKQDSIDSIGRTLGWDMPPSQPELLADRWVQELDRHGIARSALIASVHGDEDSVAAAVARSPGRFYGYFMLNPCAHGSLARAEKAFAAGLRVICLFPAMHGYSVHDERLEPILALASSRPGAAVFVHCGVLTVGVRKKLGLPSPFDLRFSNPTDLHAVALRFPQLPFIVPHFGAGYFREALMLADLCPNVHLDTSSTNSWVRYQPSHFTLADVFRRALDVVGPGRLLFGSDSSFFPRGWHAEIFNTQARVLHELALSAGDAQAIFGGNLDRLLRIS